MTQRETEIDETLSELLRAGKEPDRSLLDRVVALGPAAVPGLIEMATDETLNWADADSLEVWAPLHAVNLLGELRAAEAVEPLLPLLGIDDDWMSDALPEVYGKIGEPALEPLRRYLFNHTQDVWRRLTAARALKEIAQHHPQTRDRVVQALALYLEPKHTREPDDEMLNGYVVSYLMDLRATEAMPAIRRAFKEDRVDTSIVGELGDVQEELGLTVEGTKRTRPAEGMRMRLRCTSCRYEREHVVPRVYFDLGTAERQKRGEDTERNPVVIPQRIKCPKCGSVDEYELTPMALAAITAEMLKQGMRQKGVELPPEIDTGGESPLILLHFALEDGREMHPHAALEMYRAEVEARPEDRTLRLRLGNVLRVLGYPDEAREQYEEASRLDPQDIEAHFNLATLADERGDWVEARRRYERVVEFGPGRGLFKGKRERMVAVARETLSEMPMLPMARLTRIGDRPVLVLPDVRPDADEYAPQTVRVGPKVGRNEPCPCGSGKKYKRCHGA